jgi:four helix bundle protein
VPNNRFTGWFFIIRNEYIYRKKLTNAFECSRISHITARRNDMNKLFGFQKLEIYQQSKHLIKETYFITRNFPEREAYSLASQMNRAAVSISSNIAEGSSRNSLKDKMRFINISYGSLMELICQMEISYELCYITSDRYESFLVLSRDLSVKLNNYMNYLKKSI